MAAVALNRAARRPTLQLLLRLKAVGVSTCAACSDDDVIATHASSWHLKDRGKSPRQGPHQRLYGRSTGASVVGIWRVG